MLKSVAAGHLTTTLPPCRRRRRNAMAASACPQSSTASRAIGRRCRPAQVIRNSLMILFGSLNFGLILTFIVLFFCRCRFGFHAEVIAQRAAPLSGAFQPAGHPQSGVVVVVVVVVVGNC